MRTLIAIVVMALCLAGPAMAAGKKRGHCDPPPDCSPQCGNALATWRPPKDCPITDAERKARGECIAVKPEDRPRSCWGYWGGRPDETTQGE
jgi:hypothetical protein